MSLGDLTVNKIRHFLCKFIRLGDPASFPKAHDLRKMATSYAFFKSMTNQEICDLVGWSLIRVFETQISEILSSVVVLRSVVKGSARNAD